MVVKRGEEEEGFARVDKSKNRKRFHTPSLNTCPIATEKRAKPLSATRLEGGEEERRRD